MQNEHKHLEAAELQNKEGLCHYGIKCAVH